MTKVLKNTIEWYEYKYCINKEEYLKKERLLIESYSEFYHSPLLIDPITIKLEELEVESVNLNDGISVLTK